MAHSNLKSIRGRAAGCVLVMVVAALACTAAGALAGSDGRKGTAGATELLIPVGPRSTALGGATVAGDVTGIEAMFWNPAGLAAGPTTSALFSHTQYFADMDVNYAGVATKAGSFGSLGIAAKVLSVGDIIVTTEQAPDGTGEVLTPTFAVLGLTWARQFTDRVNFGATANYVSEKVADNQASGVAFDFGVQYITSWQGLKVGLAIKNVGGAMTFTGPGFEILTQDPSADPNAGNRGLSFSSAAFEMPSYITLSSNVDVMRNSQSALVAYGAYQGNNFSGDQVRAGLEWGYRDFLALRGSWFGTFNGTYNTAGEEEISFDSGDDLYSGYALGAGLNTRFGEASKIGIDVAWRPVRDQFDDILEVGVRLDF